MAFYIILATQVIALFVQYRMNIKNIGVGYWLVGSALMLTGAVFMSFVKIEGLLFLAMISNPLIILGHVFLYIGVQQFLDNKIEKYKPFIFFLIFNFFYYYFMFINNSASARTIVISVTLSFVSFMISYLIFFKNNKNISASTMFTVGIFSIYVVFYIFRTIYVFIAEPAATYIDETEVLIVSFIFEIIMTNLWTFGFIIMLNQRMNTDIKKEKEKLEIIFNTNIDAQLISRFEDGLIININEGFSFLLGYEKSEIIGSFIKDINFWKNPDDRELFLAELRNNGICKNKEFMFLRKDNSQFIGTISSRIIFIESVEHIISVVHDITEIKEAQDALIESEEKYRSILNASPDDITITDLEGKILMISPAGKEMFGYDSDFEDFSEMMLLDFLVPEDVERAKNNIKKLYQGGTLNSNEYKGVRRDKSIFDIEVNSRLIYNGNGVPTKMVFIVRDISARKQAESQIQKLLEELKIEKNIAQQNSITDSLTGLYNRRYFDETYKREFLRLQRIGGKLSLIMLDIDYFKNYNDTYGHLAGDKCLITIACKLKTVIERGSDIIARFGGEEFIIILPDTDEEGAQLLGERIRKEIEDLAIPHATSSISEFVTISLGVVTVNSSNLTSQEDALQIVDENLYRAKNSGRNSSVFSSIITKN